MGWRFKGGGFYNGIPARDLSQLDFEGLPAFAQELVRSEVFYEQADEIDPPLRRVKDRYRKVLLVCPTLRLEPETIDRIHGQKRQQLDFFFTRDNPHTGTEAYLNIALNMNKAREIVLRGYDAMFVVESDMLPPYDALERLSTVEADVAGGLYVMRKSHLATNAMVYDPSDPHNLTAIPLTELSGELVRTNGVSCGCVLISRDVLKEIEFRAELPLPPDTPFMKDCNEAGFVTVCDAAVVCGHKREDGRILYP